jgi:hypothetical protein
MGVLRLFQPFIEVDFPPFINGFHFETKVTLDWEVFIFTLARSPRVSSSGPSGMVCELL